MISAFALYGVVGVFLASTADFDNDAPDSTVLSTRLLLILFWPVFVVPVFVDWLFNE